MRNREWANSRRDDTERRKWKGKAHWRWVAIASVFFAAAGCAQPAPPATPTTAIIPPSFVGSTVSENDVPVQPPPYIVNTEVILTDASGFPGAPVVSDQGTIYIAGLEGHLYALTESGDILWEVDYPAEAEGTPLVLGDKLYALDRSGLNVFSPEGELLWRFEHGSGSAIAGPVAGPDGSLYYTIQAGGHGHIQAVSANGEALWQTQVQTFSYFQPPQATPNGQFVLFGTEVFSTIDGSPVDLKLGYEPDAFYVGADRQVYLLYEGVLTQWVYTDSKAILADERVISPHELGFPLSVGILENGEVWFMYPTAVAWFTPKGVLSHMAYVEKGFFTNFIAINGDGLHVFCGRSQSDLRDNGLPTCVAFSREYELAIWNQQIGHDVREFTGGLSIPGGVIVALEDGSLYRIAYRMGE